MGRGDKKTKRGKIFAGSHGKARPKPKTVNKNTAENKAETKTAKTAKAAKAAKETK